MKSFMLLAMLAVLTSSLAGAAATSPTVIAANAIPWVRESGTEFARIEGSSSGAGPYSFRIKYLRAGRSNPEYHSSVDHIIVLAGTFSIGFGTRFDSQRMRKLSAGSFIIVPRMTAHYTLATPGTIIQVYGVGRRTTTSARP